MFFFLSKLFVFILSPVSWTLILLLLSIMYWKKTSGKKFLLSGIIVLYVFSNSFLRKEAYRYWEYPLTKVEGTYTYAIVLGGFSSYDYDAERLQFTDAGDRFFQAYKLYQQGKVKRILVSGGSGSVLHPERTEADKVRDFVKVIKIPEEDYIMEDESRNTHENAVNTANWLQRSDPGATCLLITSATHMPRALGCYRKAGVNITPYATNRITEPREFDPDNLFIPKGDNLQKWEVLLKELVGSLVYKIVGYI